MQVVFKQAKKVALADEQVIGDLFGIGYSAEILVDVSEGSGY